MKFQKLVQKVLSHEPSDLKKRADFFLFKRHDSFSLLEQKGRERFFFVFSFYIQFFLQSLYW